jgi:hypothetical protein
MSEIRPVKEPGLAPLTKIPPTEKSAALEMMGELGADPSNMPST